MNRWMAGLVALACSLSLMHSSPAIAARLTNGLNGPYGGSACADVAYASTASGVAINAYPCHGGLNQQFTFEPDGTIHAFSGQCMALIGGATQTGTCTPYSWTYDGGRIIFWGAGAHQGQCLTATLYAHLTVQPCAGSSSQPAADQQWQIK
jgi:hypothetical protein